MPKFKYGFKFEPGKKYGKAQAYDLDVSPKDLAAVCDNIRGKLASEAVTFLEAVIQKKIPVRYRKWAKKLAHRRELGGAKGRYPVKAASITLKVLKDAMANAMREGILTPRIVHAAAYKQAIYERLAPRIRRRVLHRYVTARLEIVLGE